MVKPQSFAITHEHAVHLEALPDRLATDDPFGVTATCTAGPRRTGSPCRRHAPARSVADYLADRGVEVSTLRGGLAARSKPRAQVSSLA